MLSELRAHGELALSVQPPGRQGLLWVERQLGLREMDSLRMGSGFCPRVPFLLQSHPELGFGSDRPKAEIRPDSHGR